MWKSRSLPAWFINPATHTRVAGFLFEGGRYSLAQVLFPRESAILFRESAILFRASAIPSRKRYSLAQVLCFFALPQHQSVNDFWFNAGRFRGHDTACISDPKYVVGCGCACDQYKGRLGIC